MSSYQFVNPYNFIPLSAKRAEKPEKNGNLTGVIEYSVLTKTPLFIPNTSNDDVFQMGVKDHKSYDFFTYKNLTNSVGPAQNAMPVIPGSEIRGMIRSNFEILTNSCMSSVDDDIILSKRTSEVFQAGLIKRNEQGGFDLYEAEDCLMRTKGENSLEDDWRDDKWHYSRQCYIQSEFKEGTKVYFKLIERGKHIKPLAQNVSSSDKTDYDAEGYIIKGEPGPDLKGKKQQKHCCHIFTRHGKPSSPKKTDISVDTMTKVLREYKNNNKDAYKEYRDQFDIFRKNSEEEEYFPVYYSFIFEGNSEHEYLMLSPAAITREIYHTKIRDMIGSYHPCNDPNNLCPACTLFGTVVQEGEKKFALTSKIRFSDLKCTSDSKSGCFMDKITLAPLSSPKLNNMEFYLQRPSDDAVFWTYDYYIDRQGKLHPNGCTVNGRKFYWHNMSPDLANFEPSDQNITVRPVAPGTVFKGRLYFQNLSKRELDQLIFLLNAGDEEKIEKKTHGYKLGGAKPLGFGSIAISVDEVRLRGIEKDIVAHSVERYIRPYDAYEMPAFDKNLPNDFFETFKKITDFNAVENKNVIYPKVYEKNDDGTLKLDSERNPVIDQNIYEWFVENHVVVGKDGNYKQNAMTNSRMQMAFAEYMEAMNPELQSTQRQAGHKTTLKKVKSEGQLIKGNRYEAVVTGFNDKKTGVKIQIDNKNFSLFFRNIPGAKYGAVDQKLSIGQHIVVEYKGEEIGKDEKRHSQFQMIH